MTVSIIVSVVVSAILTMFGDVALKSKGIKLRGIGLFGIFILMFGITFISIITASHYLNGVKRV